MKDAKQRSLLKDLISSKLRLPDIRKIEINHILEGNKELNSFFKNWVPSKLDLLHVNYNYNTGIGIKMDFYVDSISKAIRSVSKEIYLTCFEINESELEKITKSASNWERLIFHYCDIYCLKKLDFSGPTKYKIYYLSFAICGSITPYRKSDWKSTPSSFKNIVEAISKSGLKDSLQQVDICVNDILHIGEVQAMFDELGMPHISVIKKWPKSIE